MKFLKLAFVVLVLLVNFAIARPAWADVTLTKTAGYTELTENLNRLLQTATDPDRTDYTEAEFQRQIGQLQLQKYILETSEDWARCRTKPDRRSPVEMPENNVWCTPLARLYA